MSTRQKILLALLVLVFLGGCALVKESVKDKYSLDEQEAAMKELKEISKNLESRKYLTLEEIAKCSPWHPEYIPKKTCLVIVRRETRNNCIQITPGVREYEEEVNFSSSTYPKYVAAAPFCKQALDLVKNIWGAAMRIDGLPYKAMFFLAIGEENYDEAEAVREIWLNQFEHLVKCPFDSQTLSKIQRQIKQLEIVGLTDPMLTTLRKDLAVVLKEKKWDDAQKIQNLITGRVKELTPQPQIVQKETSTPGSQTIILQQPSEQKVKVEQVPRYGATDVGRAVSLLQGKGGRLTGKEAGTLMFLDILMKR